MKANNLKYTYKFATVAMTIKTSIWFYHYIVILLRVQTLKSMLCSSRPLDKAHCTMANPDLCKVCPTIIKGSCNTKGVVYEVTCDRCSGEVKSTYIGETARTLHSRASEHLRAATNPTSHPHNAIGQHYAAKHPGMDALPCNRSNHKNLGTRSTRL